MNVFVLLILSTLIPIAYSQLLNDKCTGAIIIPSDVAALPYTSTIPNFENATINDSTYPKSRCKYRFGSIDPQSVWYYWEPSSTTLVDFSFIGSSYISASYFPFITIFEGENCKKLKELACDKIYFPAFEATAGKKYFISISAPASTSFPRKKRRLTFGVANTPPIPPNDECVDATDIPSTISFPFSTTPIQITSATENLNDPVTNCTMRYPFLNTATIETVWYTWIPKVSGLYDINTDKSFSVALGNSGIDSVIEIYKGKSCDSVKEVACSSTVEKRLRGVKLNAGIKYFIKAMTQYGDYGTSLILTVNPTPTAPLENDDCINAMVIDPFKGDVIYGDTFYATAENITSTASCSVLDTPGLWYKFSVPKEMRIDVSTCNVGTTYDTAIRIFSGDKCGKLKCVELTGSDDSLSCQYGSEQSFIASGSTTYYILVQSFDRGFGEIGGNFAMTVSGTLNYFALIDSNTDKVIRPIDNDERWFYGLLPSPKLNIQASFNDSIKSAMMTFDNPRRAVCETNVPFAVFGNNQSDYFGVPIPEGQHTVTATPYNQANCQGTAGTIISKSFEMFGCSYEFQ